MLDILYATTDGFEVPDEAGDAAIEGLSHFRNRFFKTFSKISFKFFFNFFSKIFDFFFSLKTSDEQDEY